MAEMSMDFEEAERVKLGGNKNPLERKDEETLREITTSIVSSWVREVKQALDFVNVTYPDESIEWIAVGGGSCRIPGFQEYLQRETGLPVSQINPFKSLKVNPKAFDRDYLNYMAVEAGVAVGLGLRSIRDK